MPHGNGSRRKVKIGPSLLAADFANIKEEIALVEQAGVDFLHLDVMDGRFVPNITWGPKIITDLRKLTSLPFDTHLMIVEPERYIAEFAAAGSNTITVHWEVAPHANLLISQIKKLGVRAGLSLNPATPLNVLDEILPYIDLLLIMSVNPGFSGQSYIPTSTRKIAAARELLDRHRSRVELEVDGGVSLNNLADVVRAGGDTVVMGSGIFATADPAETIARARKLCEV